MEPPPRILTKSGSKAGERGSNMPKAIKSEELVESRRGRPEGETAIEVRSALEMLSSGEADSVELELPEGVTREQVASKASRLSKDFNLKVSVAPTKGGGIGIRIRENGNSKKASQKA